MQTLRFLTNLSVCLSLTSPAFSQIRTPNNSTQGSSYSNNIVLGNSLAASKQKAKLHVNIKNGSSASTIKGIQIDVSSSFGPGMGEPITEALTNTGAFTVTSTNYAMVPTSEQDVFHIELNGRTHIGPVSGSARLNVLGNAQFYNGDHYSSLSNNQS